MAKENGLRQEVYPRKWATRQQQWFLQKNETILTVGVSVDDGSGADEEVLGDGRSLELELTRVEDVGLGKPCVPDGSLSREIYPNNFLSELPHFSSG